jgi:hypothetical protein
VPSTRTSASPCSTSTTSIAIRSGNPNAHHQRVPPIRVAADFS